MKRTKPYEKKGKNNGRVWLYSSATSCAHAHLQNLECSCTLLLLLHYCVRIVSSAYECKISNTV